jgi:hypothetical protein
MAGMTRMMDMIIQTTLTTIHTRLRVRRNRNRPTRKKDMIMITRMTMRRDTLIATMVLRAGPEVWRDWRGGMDWTWSEDGFERDTGIAIL